MERLTGIPDNELDLVLGDLEREGLSVLSRMRAADGNWTLIFGNVGTARTEPESVTQTIGFGPAVHARRTAPRTILYTDANGSQLLHIGGSRSWRNCNPGNIRKGRFTSGHGAIGDDGAFAIFPDSAIGHAALLALLGTSSYATLTLAAAIARYAPAQENDTAAYVAAVERETDIRRGTVLSTLDGSGMMALAAAITRIEGWKEGTVQASAS